MTAYLWATGIIFVMSAITHALRLGGKFEPPSVTVTACDLIVDCVFIG